MKGIPWRYIILRSSGRRQAGNPGAPRNRAAAVNAKKTKRVASLATSELKVDELRRNRSERLASRGTRQRRHELEKPANEWPETPQPVCGDLDQPKDLHGIGRQKCDCGGQAITPQPDPKSTTGTGELKSIPGRATCRNAAIRWAVTEPMGPTRTSTSERRRQALQTEQGQAAQPRGRVSGRAEAGASPSRRHGGQCRRNREPLPTARRSRQRRCHRPPTSMTMSRLT